MSSNLSATFYLISGILFILALRGLSSPETSRQGNLFGILGMIIAITVTFLSIGSFSSGFIYVLIFLLVGGVVGAFIAYKIPMTAMPELVAGFHSLVGLAAVFVAISAFLNPQAFNLGSPGDIKLPSLIEMSIGAAIGAITFSGSIIAFLKLRGIMSGSPITFKGQHYINLLLGLSIIVLIFYLCKTQSDSIFWRIIEISFLLGLLLIIPIGGADMPVVISNANFSNGNYVAVGEENTTKYYLDKKDTLFVSELCKSYNIYEVNVQTLKGVDLLSATPEILIDSFDVVDMFRRMPDLDSNSFNELKNLGNG